MKSTEVKTTFTPIVVALIIAFLWFGPLNLDILGTLLATIVVIIGSYVEYGKKAFKSLGLEAFKSNLKPMLVQAPVVAGVLFSVYVFLLIPGVTNITGQAIDLTAFEELKGNLPATLFMLAFVWVSAAFGEEIIWRGYLMRQFVKFFGDGSIALTINILLFGVLFGFCHAYQGITGQILSGIIGMVLAYIFYKRSYNLWLNIAIHGFFDTVAIILFYIGS